MKRDDLSTQIPDFISLAEAELNRRVRIRQNMTTSTLSLVAGSSSVSLPTGFMEEVELNYADSSCELNRAPFDKIDFENTTDSTSLRPAWYAITSDSIIFETEADQTYSLTLRYYRAWQIAADATNWLLTNHPDSYLFGALGEAAMWTRDPELMQLSLPRRDAAIQAALLADARNKRPVRTVDSALVGAGRFNIITG